MSVNLSELGGQISWWLDRLNEQMDTSKLQKQVKESCCGKPFETKDKAIQVLVGLQDVLLQNGLPLDDSEIQIIIAQKIDALTKETLSKAPSAPAAAAPQPSLNAPALPADPIERKIVLINRELQEMSDAMEWAKGLEVDDEDIRAMRKRFFDSYTQELKDLLEKTKAVKAKVLPEEPKKPEAEEPKRSTSPAEEPHAPPAEPSKETAAGKEPAVPAPTAPESDITPWIRAEIKTVEEQINAYKAELTVAESEGNQEENIRTLRSRISEMTTMLEDLKKALS